MPDSNEKNNSQYFASQPHSEMKIRKIFASVGAQSMSLQTASGVFSPDGIDQGSKILIENLNLPDSGPILEIGAGYGPITIWIAKEYFLRAQFQGSMENLPQIYASEINERAVWLLNRNLISNKCENVTVLKGDFLTHVEELKKQNIRFRAIYTNPPLKLGHEIMLDLMNHALELLTEDGFLLYVHKKKLGAPGFLHKLESLHPELFFGIIKKKSGYHIIKVSSQPIPKEPIDLEGYF